MTFYKKKKQKINVNKEAIIIYQVNSKMEKPKNIPKNALKLPNQSNTKTMFNELILYNSNLEYKSTKNNLNVSNQTFQQKGKGPSHLTFCSLKCQQKSSYRNSEGKQNCEKLPFLQGSKRVYLIDKYFNRHDIVKERSEHNNEKNRLSQKDTSRFQTQNDSKNFDQKIKYKKIPNKTGQIENLQKNQLRHNKSMQSIKSGQKCDKKTGWTARPKQLEEEMKEWALIKKKNEFEVFKLMKKNNYQRMKSNMIIAQALNELMDQREKLLGGQSSQQIDISQH